MRLFQRRPPSPFTWRQRITGEAAKALQDQDIARLRTLSSLMESLEKPPLEEHHPLRAVSRDLKSKLQLELQPLYHTSTTTATTTATATATLDQDKVQSQGQDSFLKNMIKLEEYLEEKSEEYKSVYSDYPVSDEAAALAPEKYMQFQTSLRLMNLQYYCKNLKEISLQDEYDPPDVSPDHVKYIIDSFLLGSGPERTAGHLRMVGHGNANFTQGLLQSTFYSILEPEVATATEVCRIVLESSKDHVKAIKKVTPIYLLDKLELNVKSRCVFAWSDPKYAGYQPLDDDQVVAAEEILKHNYEYFPESTSVAKQFVDKYISDRQMMYHDTNETTSNLKYGAVFFVITCIIDQYLGIM